jgi:hypothetical protein
VTSSSSIDRGALFVAVVLLAAACDYLDTRESAYATLAEARAAGALARGWVPEYLPASAREIRERHNVDTNEVWGRFEFDANDRAPTARACRSIDVGQLNLPGAETRGTAWWAEMLRTDPSAAAEHFELHACGTSPQTSHRRYLAVHRRMPTAFYWTTVAD